MDQTDAIDIKQMRMFAAISEFGSFSKAAVFLALSQPVLSRQIKSLEETLGVKLFYRNGRGIVLTEAGLLLQRYSKGILELVSRATAEVSAMRSTPTGRVAIGLPPSVGLVLTIPLVLRFREAFPRVAMRVAEGFSGHVLEWLSAGQIDVAVLYNAPRTGNLLSEPLFEDELFLLGAVNDPCSLPPGKIEANRLAELPLILPSSASWTARIDRSDAEQHQAAAQSHPGGGSDAVHSEIGRDGGWLHHLVLFERPPSG